MKTPQEWLRIRTEMLNDGENADLIKWITSIQDDASHSGYCVGIGTGWKQGMHDASEMISKAMGLKPLDHDHEQVHSDSA